MHTIPAAINQGEKSEGESKASRTARRGCRRGRRPDHHKTSTSTSTSTFYIPLDSHYILIQMTHPTSKDDLDFCWGKKRSKGGKHKGVQFYESFTYDGVEYFLYDSVYLSTHGDLEPYIGKLIKIWEQSGKSRKVKILWFFKPSEISPYLGDHNVLENELFLATGDGAGLANVNPLEAVAGKCNVICISKDERNRQPSSEELEKADYVFFRTFDVGKLTISDKLGEKIAAAEVRLLLNTKEYQRSDAIVFDKNLNNVVEGIDKPLNSVMRTLGGDEVIKPDAYEGVNVANDAIETKDVKQPEHLALKNNNGAAHDGQERRSISPDFDQIGLDKVIESAVKVGQGEYKTSMKLKLEGSSIYEKMKNRSPKLAVESSADFVEGSAPAADDKGKSEPLNNVCGSSIDADRKVNPLNIRGVMEDRPSKKPKLGGAAGTPKDNGRNVTHTTNDASKPAAAIAAVPNGGGRKVEKLDGSHSGRSKKLKSECTGPGSDAMVAAESNDRGKVGQELAGSSNGLPKNLKPERGGNGSAAAYGKSNFIGKKLDSKVVEAKSNEKLHKGDLKRSENVEIEAYGIVKEVTRRPEIGKSSWFHAAHWKERMEDAQVQNKLVLLQNLDPTYTSSEVEDIVWHGFRENCTAKMIQQTAITSPHSGEAFVIFKSRKAAENVCSKLDHECLMLPNGRPLVGSTWMSSFAGIQSSFPGHFIIDRLRPQMQREAKAVSTSHSSQSNTLEYEMAVEWRLLQDRADMWWKMLYKHQGGELRKLKARLKSK